MRVAPSARSADVATGLTDSPELLRPQPAASAGPLTVPIGALAPPRLHWACGPVNNTAELRTPQTMLQGSQSGLSMPAVIGTHREARLCPFATLAIATTEHNGDSGPGAGRFGSRRTLGVAGAGGRRASCPRRAQLDAASTKNICVTSGRSDPVTIGAVTNSSAFECGHGNTWACRPADAHAHAPAHACAGDRGGDQEDVRARAEDVASPRPAPLVAVVGFRAAASALAASAKVSAPSSVLYMTLKLRGGGDDEEEEMEDERGGSPPASQQYADADEDGPAAAMPATQAFSDEPENDPGVLTRLRDGEAAGVVAALPDGTAFDVLAIGRESQGERRSGGIIVRTLIIGEERDTRVSRLQAELAWEDDALKLCSKGAAYTFVNEVPLHATNAKYHSSARIYDGDVLRYPSAAILTASQAVV